jgi:hypothetical protein
MRSGGDAGMRTGIGAGGIYGVAMRGEMGECYYLRISAGNTLVTRRVISPVTV